MVPSGCSLLRHGVPQLNVGVQVLYGILGRSEGAAVPAALAANRAHLHLLKVTTNSGSLRLTLMLDPLLTLAGAVAQASLFDERRVKSNVH